MLTPTQDPVNSAALAGSWSVRETFVATVATSLPGVFPLLKHWLGRFAKGLTNLTTFSSTRYGGTKPDTSGHRTAYSSKSRGGGSKANPMSSHTFSESEERIVGNYQMHAIGGSDYSETGKRWNHNRYNGIQKNVQIDVSSETRGNQHAVGQSWLRTADSK